MKEALKLALEALEAIGSQYVCRSTHHTKAQQHHGYEACPNELTHEAAIAALREALAQPAPYMAVSNDRISVDPHTGNVSIGSPPQQEPAYRAVKTFHEGKPIYVTQPQQEPVAWLHTKIDGVVVPHRPADLDRHPERWEALYKTPSPCPTCEALARTVMMDQTGRDV